MVAWRTVAWRMNIMCGVWCGGLADGGLADDYGVWYVVYGVVAW